MNITEKNPLIISINGGLGNQLFMLCAGMSKAIDEGRDYLILPENNKRQYYFENIMNHLVNKVITVIDYSNINNNQIYHERDFNYIPIPDNRIIINGYFQSEKYFKHNFYKIKEELRLDYYKNQYKIGLKSIAIHFRLGDYLELTHYHKITSFIYYLKAIKYLKEKLIDFDEYIFIIFGEKSNNNIIDNYIKQINHNLEKPINYIKIYDRYPDNNNDYAELFYMSNCNHIIMGNSTFSWFGAYINDNPDKIIIHPSTSKWFAENIHKNMIDLIPDTWIEIDY